VIATIRRIRARTQCHQASEQHPPSGGVGPLPKHGPSGTRGTRTRANGGTARAVPHRARVSNGTSPHFCRPLGRTIDYSRPVATPKPNRIGGPRTPQVGTGKLGPLSMDIAQRLERPLRARSSSADIPQVHCRRNSSRTRAAIPTHRNSTRHSVLKHLKRSAAPLPIDANFAPLGARNMIEPGWLLTMLSLDRKRLMG
jgi:hypothetical protein